MSEFSPEHTGPFRIEQIGNRHCAVFSTFVIPAPTRARAEQLARMAVARGQMNSREISNIYKQKLIDFGKAVEGAAKQREAEKVR